MTNVLDAFGTFDKDAVDKTEEQMGSKSEWIKFPKGKTVIVRLMPPLVGEELPWVLIHQHFIKVPGGKAITFNCPMKMLNRRCPACEKEARLKGTGNPADEALASEFRAGFRAIARGIDRASPELGVRPVGFGSTVLNRLNHFRKKLNKDFTHPQSGTDVAIEFLGKAPWYQVDLAEQGPIASTSEGLEQVVAQMKALSLVSFAKVLSYDEIVSKFTDEPAMQAAPASATRAALGSSINDVDTGDEPF